MIENSQLIFDIVKVCSFFTGGMLLALLPVIAIVKFGPSPKTEDGAAIYGLCLGGAGSALGLVAGGYCLLHFAVA